MLMCQTKISRRLAGNTLPWLVWALLALVFAVVAIISTRVGLREIREDRLLESDVSYADGTIVDHSVSSGRGGPTHYAKISYRVGGTQYFVTIQGYGASKERLPLDAIVHVIYSNTNPAIAKGMAPGAETRRWTPFLLSLPWILPFLFGWLAVTKAANAAKPPNTLCVKQEPTEEQAKSERELREGGLIIGDQWKQPPNGR